MLGQLQALLIDHGFVGARLDIARRIDTLGLRFDDRSRRLGHGFTPSHSQLIGPSRHSGQRRSSVGGSRLGHHQGFAKGHPHSLHLLGAGVQGRGKFGVYIGPLGVCGQRLGLSHPAVQIGLQTGTLGQRVLPRLGGQHLNALRQKHRCFALHLGLVVQVFNRFDALHQGRLQTGQGFARQGRAGFGGIALPSHGIGQVDVGCVTQHLAFDQPLLGQGVLAFGTTQLVKLFAQHLGSPFVAVAHFGEYRLQHLGIGVFDQPVAQSRGTLARGRCGEGTAGQGI